MALDGHLEVAVADDAVEFTVTVRNTGGDPVDLEFRSGQTVDVAVTEGETETWRWSDDRMFTPAIKTETLAPGESLTRTLVWEDPESGEYAAEATLDARDVDLAEREGFSV